jgi:hypothetical protein
LSKDAEADEIGLTELFAKIGARNPSLWAQSQIHEGIPQLGRFLFLREAWRLVVEETGTAWIDENLKVKEGTPGWQVSPALHRLLASGAKKEDISIVARTAQWRLLFDLCRLVDGPGSLEKDVADMEWRLFQVDANGAPTAAITSLHESVLETEPSGTEMGATGNSGQSKIF